MAVDFFEENANNIKFASQIRSSPVSAGLSGWLIKKGFAKDKTGANIILVSTLLICLIATAVILWMYSRPRIDNIVPQNIVNEKMQLIQQ